MSRDWHGRLGVFLTDVHATVTPRLHVPHGRTPPLEVIADAQGNLLTSDDHPSTHLRYPCGARYEAMPSRRWRHHQQALTPWLEKFLPTLGLSGSQQHFLLAYANRLPPAPYYDATILTPSKRKHMVGEFVIVPKIPLFEAVFLFQPAYERLRVQAPPPYHLREPTDGPSATLVGGFYRKDEELTLPIPHLVQHAPFRQHVVMARSPDGRRGR